MCGAEMASALVGSAAATSETTAIPIVRAAPERTDTFPVVAQSSGLGPPPILPSVLRRDPSPPRRRPSGRLIAVVAGAVLVVGGIVVGLAVSSSSGHRSAAPTQQGAAAVSGLLDRSNRARQSVTQVVTGVETCQLDARQGLTVMGNVVQVREQVLADLRMVNAPTQLTSALNDALRLSLEADRHFQDWMSFVALNGCTGRAPHNADFSAANATSSQASAAKQRFVDLWNLLAASDGMRQYHATDF
jgi:hypothetical protein